jgi:hypothetical protein
MRIRAITNLYPNPYQPHRATFNRQQFRSLAARHSVAIIAPIAWTDELTARLRLEARLPGVRREVLDGIAVEHHATFIHRECSSMVGRLAPSSLRFSRCEF